MKMMVMVVMVVAMLVSDGDNYGDGGGDDECDNDLDDDDEYVGDGGDDVIMTVMVRYQWVITCTEHLLCSVHGSLDVITLHPHTNTVK